MMCQTGLSTYCIWKGPGNHRTRLHASVSVVALFLVGRSALAHDCLSFKHESTPACLAVAPVNRIEYLLTAGRTLFKRNDLHDIGLIENITGTSLEQTVIFSPFQFLRTKLPSRLTASATKVASDKTLTEIAFSHNLTSGDTSDYSTILRVYLVPTIRSGGIGAIEAEGSTTTSWRGACPQLSSFSKFLLPGESAEEAFSLSLPEGVGRQSPPEVRQFEVHLAHNERLQLHMQLINVGSMDAGPKGASSQCNVELEYRQIVDPSELREEGK